MSQRHSKNGSSGRRTRRGDSIGLGASPAIARRQRLARKMGAEKELIACAAAVGDYLFVWSCEPLLYVAPIQGFPALSRLSGDQVRKFRVSPSGSRMHWARSDVDLDLEAIRRHAVTVLRSASEFREKRVA